MNIHQSTRLTQVANSLICLSQQERSELYRYLDGCGVSPTPQPPSEKESGLTLRQKEVLTFVANGYTRREISDSLSISIHTVSSHIKNIYDRLEITSKADATRMAVAFGLLVVSQGRSA